MAKAAEDISARNFHEPLLKVLGSKTKYDSGRIVEHSEVYDPICEMMGLERFQYGAHKDGVSKIDKWIQWAFQKLCDTGLGEAKGRGKWALTPDGVDKVRAMMNVLIPNDQTAEDLANLIVGMDAPVPVVSDGMYHDDPYIRELALATHGCFGAYSNNSALCLGCPARRVCEVKLVEQLAALAEELDESDRVQAARRTAKGVQAELGMDEEAQVEMPKYKPPHKDFVVIEQTMQKAGGVGCAHCKGNIDEGAASLWIRWPNKVDPLKKDSVFVHPTCFS